MPVQPAINPVIVSKIVLWIIVVIVATIFLSRQRMKPTLRIYSLFGGTLVFGFIYGVLISKGTNPNPVLSLRNLLTSILVRGQLIVPVAVMLIILLMLVFISNKSICGWGCQFGLLQELMHRLKLPKWKPQFWVSNTIRIAAFAMLVLGLVMGGLDLIGIVDPFQLFQLNLTLWIGISLVVILGTSLFIYRPWCQFLCPFGMIGWLVEQVSVLRPRIKREACKDCQLCVEACPTQAMADFHAGKTIHADCFVCGDCISACPKGRALRWSRRSSNDSAPVTSNHA